MNKLHNPLKGYGGIRRLFLCFILVSLISKLVCRNHRYSGMYIANAHNIKFNRYRCEIHIYLAVSEVRAEYCGRR